MSSRLDLPLAALAWVVGFAIVGATGSWLPLAALALLAAARLVALDPATRRLLRPRRHDAAIGALCGSGMAAVTYGAYALLSPAIPALPPATAELYGVLNAGGYGRLALPALVVVVATCEEIVWRGRTLEPAAALAGARRLSRPAALRVLAVACLYGLAHLPSGSALLALLAAGCGLVWGLLRVAGRSIWPAVVTHALWDLAILVVWPLA